MHEFDTFRSIASSVVKMCVFEFCCCFEANFEFTFKPFLQVDFDTFCWCFSVNFPEFRVSVNFFANFFGIFWNFGDFAVFSLVDFAQNSSNSGQ